MTIWDTKQEHIEQSKLLVSHQGKPSKTYLQAIKITPFTVLNPLFSLSQRLAVGSVKPGPTRVLVQTPPKPSQEAHYLYKKKKLLSLLFLLKGHPLQEDHLLTHPFLQAPSSSSFANKGAVEAGI